MSIQNVAGTPAAAQTRRTAARSGAPGSSFLDQLTQTAAGAAVTTGPDIHLRMPTENTVFSGSHAGQNGVMQSIYAEYTLDSTPADPTVRITGTSDSGPYDITRRINDINPSSASYAELTALYGHLVKTGAYQSALPSAFQGPLPTGMDVGDITQAKDYISEIRNFQADPHVFGPYKDAQVSEALNLYQNYASGAGPIQSASAPDHGAFMKDDLLSSLADFRTGLMAKMKEAKEKEEEQKAWDQLMEYLDAWIESLREEADVRKIARAHAALTALQTDAGSDRPDLAGYLLQQLENIAL